MAPILQWNDQYFYLLHYLKYGNFSYSLAAHNLGPNCSILNDRQSDKPWFNVGIVSIINFKKVKAEKTDNTCK